MMNLKFIGVGYIDFIYICTIYEYFRRFWYRRISSILWRIFIFIFYMDVVGVGKIVIIF